MPRTFTMTAAQVFAGARALLADKGEIIAPHTPDSDLMRSLNNALANMVAIVPGLFGVQEPHTCVDGYLQELTATRASMFMDVIGLPEADPATLSQYAPGWQNEARGPAENYMRVPGDTLRFMLYPPAQVGQVLQIRYALQPAEITSSADVVPVPETYGPALQEFVAGHASLSDDEHVNSGRAAALLERFAATVKALGGA